MMMKRAAILILVCICSLIFCLGCNEKEEEKESRSVQYEKHAKFTTEYEIDYYEAGFYRVSKNNALEGVLNGKGKEIVPVKYDNVSILSDIGGNVVYISAQYENETTLFDSNGKEVMRLSELVNLQVQSSYYDGETYIVVYGTDGLVTIYDTMMRDVVRLDYGKCSVYVISADCYLIDKTPTLDDLSSRVYVVNRSGNVIGSYVGGGISCGIVQKGVTLAEEGTCLFYFQGSDEYGIYSIDREGNTQFLVQPAPYNLPVTFQDGKVLKSNFSNGYRLYNGGLLWEQNGIWKITGCEGDYDKRYYSCYPKMDNFFLVNEDNEVCVINRSGEIIADYKDDFTFESNKVYFKDEPLDWDCCESIAGGFAVIEITEKEGKNKVETYVFR